MLNSRLLVTLFTLCLGVLATPLRGAIVSSSCATQGVSRESGSLHATDAVWFDDGILRSEASSTRAATVTGAASPLRLEYAGSTTQRPIIVDWTLDVHAQRHNWRVRAVAAAGDRPPYLPQAPPVA